MGSPRFKNLERIEKPVWKTELALSLIVKRKWGMNQENQNLTVWGYEIKRKGRNRKKKIFEESLLREQRVTLGDVLEIWGSVIFSIFHKTRLTKESLIKGLLHGVGEFREIRAGEHSTLGLASVGSPSHLRPEAPTYTVPGFLWSLELS